MYGLLGRAAKRKPFLSKRNMTAWLRFASQPKLRCLSTMNSTTFGENQIQIQYSYQLLSVVEGGDGLSLFSSHNTWPPHIHIQKRKKNTRVLKLTTHWFPF